MTFMTHIGSGAGSTWIREAIFTSDPGWGGLEAQGLLHAEDGAIFGFETALDTYYPEPIEGNPPLRMVVVGVKGADRKRKPPKGKRQDLCPECSKVSQKLEIVVSNADGTISDRGRRRAEKRLIEEQEPEKKKREEEEAMFDDPDFWAAVEYSAQGQRTTQYRGL